MYTDDKKLNRQIFLEKINYHRNGVIENKRNGILADQMVTFKCTKYFKEIMEEMCEELNITKSELIRLVVNEFYDDLIIAPNEN